MFKFARTLYSHKYHITYLPLAKLPIKIIKAPTNQNSIIGAKIIAKIEAHV